jgi:hypothetical protein
MATVSAVIVTGWTRPLAIGEQAALTASAIYSDGSQRDVTQDSSWDSSNVHVATVRRGVVTAISEGATAIIARFADKDGNQGVTVQGGATPIPGPDPAPRPLPPAPSPPPGLACGTERWFVKTLADADATKVSLSAVTPISIRDLNGLSTHCSGLPESRTYADEYRVFEVLGRISYVAHEDDRDYQSGVSGFTISLTVSEDVRGTASNCILFSRSRGISSASDDRGVRATGRKAGKRDVLGGYRIRSHLEAKKRRLPFLLASCCATCG